ncbi:DoxX family membrane protein [Candidatus Kaiserbacteria bacterium]|nr:DoxX family membrane protein [Candidatus Kaiserbacteria bacterium]
MKCYFRFLGVLVLLAPCIALAHTRWFAEAPLPPVPQNEPTALYLSVWAVVVVGAGILAYYFDRHSILQLNFLHLGRDHAFERAAATFSMVAGAFFVVAATHGYLFAPVLTQEAGVPQFLLTVELLAGIMLLTGVYSRIGALVILSLSAWLASSLSLLTALEHAWVVGAALFIGIMGSDYFTLVPMPTLAHMTHRFRPWALPLLRVGAGATLLTLGFSEKILDPALGLDFLAQHQWNFMALLGLPYSDYLFVLSAGAVESLLGSLLILGLCTRLVALTTLGIFAIPMFLMGPLELTGHLPHLAALVLLVFFSGGNRMNLVVRRTRG